jgi:glycosyltransferase involved in cell wall biosynthesis
LRHPTVKNKISLIVCRLLEELLSLDVDIILIQRSALSDLESAEAVIKHCKEKGISLVYEVDDDLFAASEKKEVSKAYPKQVQEAIKLIMEKADRITTSSPFLKDQIQTTNYKVSYLPNALDESLWLEKDGERFIKPGIEPQDNCVRILYMGTRTHGEDLQLVKKAYKKIKQEYGDKVILEVVGGFPYGMKTFGRVVPIEGIDSDSDDYPNFVSWIRKENRWDFGIIPLALTDFNRKKSYIKFLDYSALGLAAICSDIEPYREVVEEGRNGILVPNETEAWYEAIKRLIEDPDLRATLAANAFDDLLQKHLLKANAEKHLRLYQEIFRDSRRSGNLSRNEILEFDEESYITYNPDVAEAIKKGQFLSARHHWEVCGRNEMAAGLRAYRPRGIVNYSRRRSLTLPMRQQLRKETERWDLQPLVSIIMPVYNVDKAWLDKAVQSVKSQIYPHWELCIADDCSTNQETITYLKRLQDERIKVKFLNKNQGISIASNEALALAQGEYIALLDNDDELTEDALYEVAKAINEHQPDLIYSDEDKISLEGELIEPHFKPDYSPDMILSQNYISHLSVYLKSIVDEVGGFREGLEGSQDYDLLLRFLEKSEKVHHIPKILYHWRKVPGSTADRFHSKSYAWEAGKTALQEAMQRRTIKAQVQLGKYPGTYRVKREILGNPLVSILVPFKDEPKLLKQCIDSILDKSSYDHFEIIGLSNNSVEEETFSIMENYQNQDKRISFKEYNYPFNFSAINNYGVTFARGEHVVLLNNDIEIISGEWIEALLEHSQRPEIGAVGGKLYFPNETIQHAGVIVGLGGVAGHSHKHFPRNIEGYFYQPNIVRNISAVTAACLMIKKKIYEEVKGLEEKYLRIAFNDVDFCLRVMERGYLNVYTPYCQAYHHESVSRGYEDTPEKKARFATEIKYITKRHAKILKRGDPYYNPNLTLDSEDFGLRLVG